MRMFVLGLSLLSGWGCGLIGPSCLSRQKTGPVTTVVGEVAPAQIGVHRVPYDTEGSQNDARISWVGQGAADGPRISVHATRVGCADFRLPPQTNSGACALLASAGSIDGQIATTLVITNGRGNPDVLGSPAEYKLWVVGDPAQTARYTIDITWFYGPDC